MAEFLTDKALDALVIKREDFTLNQYQEALSATLGAIAAHTLVQSRESSRVIRECSKQLDNMSTQLRKDLLALEKLMVINNDQSN